jgi:glycosyltransferase involved in cell wall biosynthesis
MITELGLAGRVRLLGWRREVAELIAGADLFVLSSRWEGMPNVVLEAMACGRPVVATDIPGTAELVVPDVTGLLVPRDDPGALAAAIERLLHNQQLAASLGSSGRERARQVFPLAAMVRQNVELYRRILADPSVTSSPADSPPGT